MHVQLSRNLTYNGPVSARLKRLIAESKFDPTQCVVRQVTRLSRALVARFDTEFAPTGLTSQQFTILMTLVRAGSMNVGELSNFIGMDQSTTTRALRPLERDGLIKIATGKDRRQRIISATVLAETKLANAFPRWENLQATVLSNLGSQEWQTTIQSLRTIRKSITT
jgi:DNA-binding MarR family transcriptional regulator